MAEPGLLLFTLTLGALAFFSPCGFPMLPAYVAYYLPRAGESRAPLPRAILRGLGGGALAAAGALAVLAAIGGAAVALGAPFKERVLLLELVGGLVVVALGALVLSGKGPSFRVPLRPARRQDALGLFAFGALYAGTAAGCVAPVFLFVLFSAAAAPTPVDGAIQVGAYAVGLGGMLVALTVLVATAQETFVRGMRRVLPHVERLSGIALILVGLYLVAYWARVEGYL